MISKISPHPASSPGHLYVDEDDPFAEFDPTERARLERIAGHVRGILEELDLDLDDPNLRETDLRVAKMYAEMFHGLQEGNEPLITTFPNDDRYSGMVMYSCQKI